MPNSTPSGASLTSTYVAVIVQNEWTQIHLYQMPRKIRELIQDLKSAGFYEISGGKGSHRKFVHINYAGAVTISGNIGEDAKIYQEKQVEQALEEVKG